MKKISFKDIKTKLTAEELKEIEAAEQMEAVFDEDSPEMTTEMLKQFKRENREKRVKQTISLRLSPQTVRKAKSYGQGYTSFLSRLIELAINNQEMVKKCL